MKQKHHTYWNQEQAKTTRNQPKGPESNQNDPKPAKTTQKIVKQPETTQNFKFSTSFGFSNFKPKFWNLGILGQ